MLELGDNGDGIFTNTAGSIYVTKGSASSNRVADFHFGTGGSFSIEGYRSEGAHRFFEPGTTIATTAIRVVGCDITPITAPDGIAIYGSWGDQMLLENCRINGKVGWGQVYGNPTLYPGSLTMVATQVADSQPFRSSPDAEGLSYVILGCRPMAANGEAGPRVSDMIGSYTNANGGLFHSVWQVAFDPTTFAGKLGLFGAPPVPRPAVSGSRSKWDRARQPDLRADTARRHLRQYDAIAAPAHRGGPTRDRV